MIKPSHSRWLSLFVFGGALVLLLILGGAWSSLAAPQEAVAVWIGPHAGGTAVFLSQPGQSPRLLADLDAWQPLDTALAPDGEWLAISAGSPLGEAGGETLFLIAIPSGRLHTASQGLQIGQLHWRADGEQLAYVQAYPAKLETDGKTGQSASLEATQEALVVLDIASGRSLERLRGQAGDGLFLHGWEGADVLLQSNGQTTRLSAGGAGPSSVEAALTGLDGLAQITPIDRLALTGSVDALRVIDLSDGRTRLVQPAERGLSAAWAADGSLWMTRLDQAAGETNLVRWNLDTRRQAPLASLGSGLWRILSASPQMDWLAARRAGSGDWLIRISDGVQFPLNPQSEDGRFIGWLSPEALEDTTNLLAIPMVSLGDEPTPTQTPVATPGLPPTCGNRDGCSVVPRYSEIQPVRLSLAPKFVQAAANQLGINAPPYNLIYTGMPGSGSNQPVSSQRPIPNPLMRTMAWQESFWTQFAYNPSTNTTGYLYIEDTTRCTLVSFDCGYGMMQITSGMTSSPPPADYDWFDQQYVSANVIYNLGTGTNFMIGKWNGWPYYIGPNDPTDPADWYMAVMAYNGVASSNDPNLDTCDPDRSPYYDRNPSNYVCRYPYQERVYGYLQNPYVVSNILLKKWLWRPERYAEAPRGLFGLSDTWRPLYNMPQPFTTIFHRVLIDVGNNADPILTATNTTGSTAALDILFYDSDDKVKGTYNRRWLDPSGTSPFFAVSYLRLAPGQQRSFRLSDVFPGEDFWGYVRVHYTQGITLSLSTAAPADPPPAPNCTQLVQNGGFEVRADGRAAGWTATSLHGFALSDSTWMAAGNFGANLGGMDGANDVISQTVTLPAGTFSATLSFDYAGWTQHLAGDLALDSLTLRVLDDEGTVLPVTWSRTNQGLWREWQEASLDVSAALQGQTGLPVTLEFTALNNDHATDDARPSSFFVDNVQLTVCSAAAP